MLKRLLLLSACLCATTSYISADLIGGALNLARGAVDTAANVAEGTIDVVDEGTYRARGPHFHIYEDEPFLHGGAYGDTYGDVLIENRVIDEPSKVTVEKTVTTYEE